MGYGLRSQESHLSIFAEIDEFGNGYCGMLSDEFQRSALVLEPFSLPWGDYWLPLEIWFAFVRVVIALCEGFDVEEKCLSGISQMAET